MLATMATEVEEGKKKKSNLSIMHIAILKVVGACDPHHGI